MTLALTSTSSTLTSSSSSSSSPSSFSPSHFTHTLAGPLTRYPTSFSLDRKLLYLPSSSSLRLYSLSTLQLLLELRGHTAELTAVLPDPSNSLCVYTASRDGTIRKWNQYEGVEIEKWEIGAEIMHCVMVKGVFYCNVRSERKEKEKRKRKGSDAEEEEKEATTSPSLTGNTDPSSSSSSSSSEEIKCRVIAFTPPSALSSSSSSSSSLSIRSLYKSRSCISLLSNPSGSHLFSISKQTLTVYNLHTGEVLRYLHTATLTCLAFHPYNDYLVTGDSTGKLILWYNYNDEKKLIISSLPHWHAHAVASICFTPDGAYLLSGGEESVLVIWQMDTGYKQFIPRLYAPINHISISYSSSNRNSSSSTQYYVVSGADNCIRFINSITSRIVKSIQGLQYAHTIPLRPAEQPCHTNLVPYSHSYSLSSSSSSNGSRLGRDIVALTGRVGVIQLYDVREDREVREIDVTQRLNVSRMDEELMRYMRVEKVAWGSLGEENQHHNNITNTKNQLITSTSRSTTSPSSTSSSTSTDVSSSTTVMVTVERRIQPDFADKIILKVWHYSSSHQQYLVHTRLEAPHGEHKIQSVVFHPSLPLFVTVGADRTFRIWTLQKKEEIVNTANRNVRVGEKETSVWVCSSVIGYRDMDCHSADISSDGSLLAVSFGQIITLWDLHQLSLQSTLIHPHPSHSIRSLHFIPNTHYLVSYTDYLLSCWNLLTLTCWWSWAMNVTNMAVQGQGKEGLFAVCVNKQKSGITNSSKGDSSVTSNGKRHKQQSQPSSSISSSSLPLTSFDAQLNHLLIFHPSSPHPLFIHPLDQLRLERLDHSSLLFSSYFTWLGESIVYMNRRKQLVRIEVERMMKGNETIETEEKEDSGKSNGLKALNEEGEMTAFERIYGKATLISQPTNASSTFRSSATATPSTLAPSTASISSGSHLFSAPSHVLPPAFSLFSAFMNNILVKSDAVIKPPSDSSSPAAEEEKKSEDEMVDEEAVASASVAKVESGKATVSSLLDAADAAVFESDSRLGVFQFDFSVYQSIVNAMNGNSGSTSSSSSHNHVDVANEKDEMEVEESTSRNSMKANGGAKMNGTHGDVDGVTASPAKLGKHAKLHDIVADVDGDAVQGHGNGKRKGNGAGNGNGISAKTKIKSKSNKSKTAKTVTASE